jgi:8-oxo-dGTP pyrophosphatase MutT (NUDIX family)
VVRIHDQHYLGRHHAIPVTPSRRPGYGRPHPELGPLLAGLTPAATERIVWGGDIPLSVAAYLTSEPPPEELVTSVRCVVRVADRIIACETPDGWHIWPGGRRRPGESYQQTVRREVLEETGWLLHAADPRRLGFLHLRLIRAQAADYPWPHPDFLQLVYTATASTHADPGSDWVDVEGWEQGHRLLTRAELRFMELSPAQWAFLDAACPADR